MNRSNKLVLVLALGALGIAASGGALADHGRVHFGFYFGVPLWGPQYYPAPYYYYPPVYAPPVVVPASPPTYVEQTPQAAPSQPQAYWYYCADTKSYYPYVKECPGGWQRVAPEPAN